MVNNKSARRRVPSAQSGSTARSNNVQETPSEVVRRGESLDGGVGGRATERGEGGGREEAAAEGREGGKKARRRRNQRGWTRFESG